MKFHAPSATALLLAFLVSSNAVQAQPSGLQGAEVGVWSGGLQSSSGGQIIFTFTSIGGVGSLKFETRGWEEFGFGTCEYVFEMDGGAHRDIYLNTASNRNANCPDRFPFEVARSGDDTLQFTPGPEAAAQSKIDTLELRAGVRPWRPEDARAGVDAIDILGMTPAMERTEIENILEEAGFEHLESGTIELTGNGYTQNIDFYGRSPREDGWSTDIISIPWTADKSWDENTPVAMTITRDWSIPEDAKLSIATLKASLQEKYGIDGTYPNQIVVYGRDGGRLQDGSCPKGSLQAYPYRAPSTTYDRFNAQQQELSPYCGPSVGISTNADRATGRATELHITVTDPDEVWKNFWATWSHGEAQRLQDLHDSIAGLRGTGPEL